MKKIFLSIIAIILVNQSQAQTSDEVGVNLGFSNYLGDLQDNDVSFSQGGLAFGFFAKHNFSSSFALRGNLNYGRLRATDENSDNQLRRNRNLSFRSHIIEIGVSGEISMLPFDQYNYLNDSRKRYFNWTPYLFGGVNLFHFNPKTRYQGRWVALQPLKTEGQNSTFSSQPSYALTQISIPFGVGFKYQFGNRIGVAVEIGARKTFTDYLDDVSGVYPDMDRLKTDKGNISADLSYRGDELPQGKDWNPSFSVRGNSANDDWYMFNTISVSYKFYKK